MAIQTRQSSSGDGVLYQYLKWDDSATSQSFLVKNTINGDADKEVYQESFRIVDVSDNDWASIANEFGIDTNNQIEIYLYIYKQKDNQGNPKQAYTFPDDRSGRPCHIASKLSGGVVSRAKGEVD